jgi:hypothetical protein
MTILAYLLAWFALSIPVSLTIGRAIRFGTGNRS